VTALEAEVHARLEGLEADAFLARLDVVRADLVEALTVVYGDSAELLDALIADALDAAAARSVDLRRIDRRREVDPTWFLSQDLVGYVCYADRFAGDLGGVAKHVDYLAELGVGYLHLMPLLRPREGENDGGYAVADYDAVDPRLGTVADLEALAATLHERGISLCVDLVLNHTAQEHEWAQRALAGDPTYRDFYRFFPDRTEPDEYERTLHEVFPDMAPGSFTQLPGTGEWVWTTFHEFQWDLNWANPEVFRAMLGVLLRLANRGVDVVRLDAAPFLWKRKGTNCLNQPEAHRILQAIKALTRLAAPGLVLKAEAIVGPDQLVPYLGGHEHHRPECDLAYDNQLMVMLWNTLATRDARLARQALGRRTPPPAGTGWVTYVRCHDDIGWAVDDGDAWAVGLDPAAHRRFLVDFYAGSHPGSFARGARFGDNPETGDARTSGAAASLAGLDHALDSEEPDQVDAALRRLETLHAVVFSYGGIPLIYMGDELAQRNDDEWAADPAHSDDNRWLHRPRMDWAAAARRVRSDTVEGRAFAAMSRLVGARQASPSLRSDGSVTVLEVEPTSVLAYVRRHPRAEPLLVLANFSDRPAAVADEVLRRAGISAPVHVHSSVGTFEHVGASVHLPAWGFVWVRQSA